MEKNSTLSRSAGRFLIIFLTFFFLSGTLFASEIRINNGTTGIQITANTYENLSFSATLSSIQYRNVQTKLGPFTELFVQEYGFSNTVGDPKLPVFHRLIEVPLHAGFSVQITREKYKEYDLSSYGILAPVIPAQAPLSKNITDPAQVPFILNSTVYQKDEWVGSPVVKITPVGILRSLNLARLDISPVWYNPVTGKLRVYEQLDVTVSFTNADVAATLQLKKDTWSPYFSNLTNGVSNFKQMPDSLITHAPVTYVIISPSTFQNALQPFIAWKKKKGFRVIEGYTSNPAVGTTTTSIKNYLEGLYNTPPAGYQKPSFVLFVGDVAQVPAWTTNGHPSDLYYCDYTSDNIPEVFYGRFSASTLAQLQPYIDKTLEYEQYLMPSDNFLGEASMIAGADPNNGPLYGNGQINYGTSTYFNSAHNILSHTYLQPEPSGGNYTNSIHQDVSNGVCYSNYTAHGSEAGWADPSFVISDIAALQNNHKYCLMVGNCCKTSNFGANCFAEEVTRAANKGALGYIGCSDYSYWDEDYWWACGFKAVTTNPVYSAQHLGAYDVTFHDHGEPTSKWFVTQGQMVVGGNLAVEESSSGMKLYYWETYCLMGDPSLSVYFSAPPPVAATYTSPVLVGESSLTVTTEPHAYVALTINDTTLLDAECADSTGIVNLAFSPLTSPDSLSLVITKQNRKPFIGFVQVIPATGPYVILNSYTVNDSVGGNHDHDADYCEAIQLNVTVKNIGVLEASNIAGTLSTPDTNVIITSANFNFGNLLPGGTVTGENAFAMTIKDYVPDQHNVFCTLLLTDGTNEWTSTLILILNAPVLNIGTVTVLDPAPGGNANGILDPGESATLKILTNNIGHAASSNTIAHLTVPASSAPYILITNPDTYIGTLNTGTLNYAFFDVITNGITPAGTPVNLDYRVTGGNISQYVTEDSIHLMIGQTPVFLMGNTTTTTCSGKFYDSGGEASNYSDNESYTYTFNPGTSGAKIRAVFSAFDVEPETNCGYDWMKVFNGPDITSPLLGTYCGTTVPGPLESTTGPLTFQFSSDYNVNMTGWTADISCAGGPLNIAANAFPPYVCQGSSSQLVAIVTGGSGNYTYQWTPSTYLDNPTSRTPVSTPAANISYTVTVNDGSSSLTSGTVSLTVHALPPTPVITLNGSTLTSSSATGNQWYLNGAMIPGATTPVYSPTASGQYYVVVSDPVTGCPSQPSNSINFLLTGIDALGADRQVSVYPNPFRDKITITYLLQDAGTVKISLFDAFGKEVRVIVNSELQNPGKHTAEIAGSSLGSGVYILKIQTSTYSVSKKVILTD
jgi:hypothetical protein